MKPTNQIFAIILTLFLSLNPMSLFSQEEAPKRPKFVAATTMHWNMDLEDFNMDEWKAIEKEFLDKVTMKNEFIMGASVYLHLFSTDNTELISVQTFASWEDMGKFGQRNNELIKEAWPDEAERKAFMKKRNAYYANEHSDEIYATISGAKLLAEKPTQDMVMYLRKNYFSFPEDGSQDEFETLRKEGFDAIIDKNEYIKAYYPNVHAWGSERTEFIEAYYLDTMCDVDKMFDRNTELIKEAFPDEEARKAKMKAWGNYFTGVHGDYLYTWIHELSK